MNFKNTEVWGFKHAIRGMRNPLESWNKIDTVVYENNTVTIGENDLTLMKKLIAGGSEHRKFMRQIFVSVDITAPMYWWSEFDTYKIGTTANSTSKMHKLASTPITIDCFETDDFDVRWFSSTGIEAGCDTWIKDNILYFLESLRQEYLKTKDKRYWKELIRWLPESWLQTRTVTMNYENIYNIIRQRKGHKLTEWHQFIEWARTLPCAQELLFEEES